MDILISILIFIIVLAVVWYIIRLLPFDQTVKNIILAILLLVALIWVLRYSGWVHW
jgi:hypothetical protein